MHELEHRLAQLAERGVGIELGRARLAIEQNGGHHRPKITVRAPAKAHAAVGVGAGREGRGGGLDVARRRVGAYEALDEQLRVEGRNVLVGGDVPQHRVRLVLGVARRRVARDRLHKLRRVAELEAGVGADAHRRLAVGEEDVVRAVARHLEDGVRLDATVGTGGPHLRIRAVARGRRALRVHPHIEDVGRRAAQAEKPVEQCARRDRVAIGHDGRRRERHVAQAAVAVDGATRGAARVGRWKPAVLPADAEDVQRVGRVVLQVDARLGRVVHDRDTARRPHLHLHEARPVQPRHHLVEAAARCPVVPEPHVPVVAWRAYLPAALLGRLESHQLAEDVAHTYLVARPRVGHA